MSKDLKVEIRAVGPADLEAISAIERRSFPSPWTRLAFIDMYQRNPEKFIVSVVNGNVVGYAIACIERSIGLRFRKTGHLLKLAVEKKWRRRRIGTKLLRVMVDRLRKEGVADIRLEVRAENLEARSFYLKSGFRNSKIVDGYYQDGAKALIMVKEI